MRHIEIDIMDQHSAPIQAVHEGDIVELTVKSSEGGFTDKRCIVAYSGTLLCGDCAVFKVFQAMTDKAFLKCPADENDGTALFCGTCILRDLDEIMEEL
jgi:hypothetical protein